VGAYTDLASWSAVSTRLAEMDQNAAYREEIIAANPPSERHDKIEISGLTLKAKELDLLEDTSFKVPDGKWAMLTGPEGAGKTTVMRAMRGIWPTTAGKVGPKLDDNVRFVPAAKSSGLRFGTLVEAAAYPDRVGRVRPNHAAPPAVPELVADDGADAPLLGPQADDDAEQHDEIDPVLVAEETELLNKALGELKLQYLIDAFEADPTPRDWGRELSSGEMQRMMLARILVCKPDFLFMDEPVAHCAEGEATAGIFNALKGGLPTTTVLTITHDLEIKTFHDIQLVIDPKSLKIDVQG